MAWRKLSLSFTQVVSLVIVSLSGCTAVRDTALKRLQDSCFINPVNCAFAKDEYSWVQTSPRCGTYDAVRSSRSVYSLFVVHFSLFHFSP